ncbi:MAG: rhodanese-like domain-containing protein [Proteobacteria bacterium]|nr:rhodanese-like domain-containing protein [Pseudomonadota bacterium]
MKKTFKILLSLLFISTLLSASYGAAESYKDISPRQVKNMLNKGKKGVMLLDVRTSGEYKTGHLKNSILIPIQVLEKRINEISAFKDKELIIYCAVGGRSSRAATYLTNNGFNKVYNMSGGINAWSRLGYEIEQ